MDHFDIKAREKERQFFRKMVNREFSTGQGRKNIIVKVTNKEVFFMSRCSKEPQRIDRDKIRSAIRHLFYKRTMTRVDLDKKFKCKFNSAALGLIRSMFIEIARIHKSCKNGLMRITLQSVRHFFSGAVRAPKDLMLAIHKGAKFFLISYAHVRHRKNWYLLFERMAKEHGIKLLIDSGAFTVHQAIQNGKDIEPIIVEEYSQFLEQFKDLIYGYFTLDVIGDPEASANNTAYMRAQGLNPIEVFHYGSSFDNLKEMVDQDQELIGIGGTVGMSEKQKRAFFKELFQLFPGQLLHILGCGSALILEFLFFSSDSTTWLMGRKFLFILTPKQTPAPKGWTGDDCVAHNAWFQSQFEFWYEGAIQMEMSFIA
jgi:hypothetical protein